jgi:putative transposase
MLLVPCLWEMACHDGNACTTYGPFRGPKSTSTYPLYDHSSGSGRWHPSTVLRWVKRYGEKGFAGLTNAAERSDKGQSRPLPPEAITLIEGLVLQTPPRSAAAIHGQVTAVAREQGWKPPSYVRVRQITKNLDPALVTLAHQGTAAYREAFDLLYRREATHAMWQADHTSLDVWLLDEEGRPAKP